MISYKLQKSENYYAKIMCFDWRVISCRTVCRHKGLRYYSSTTLAAGTVLGGMKSLLYDVLKIRRKILAITLEKTKIYNFESCRISLT